ALPERLTLQGHGRSWRAAGHLDRWQAPAVRHAHHRPGGPRAPAARPTDLRQVAPGMNPEQQAAIAARLVRVRGMLSERGWQALWLGQSTNLRYLSGVV